MGKEAEIKENEEQVTNKTAEKETLTFLENGRPEPLITLKDDKVYIKTFQLSMSRKHRIVLFMDVLTIAWASGLTVGMSMASTLVQYVWIIAPIGALALFCAIGKTITDFQNWLFTMNAMQAKMGDWYMEDVIGICQDFINAGAKFAAEEVKKAVEEKTATEASGGPLS